MDMEQRNQMIERLKAACPEYANVSHLYFEGSGGDAAKIFEKAMKAYAHMQADETPLACFGSDLEGFVLTTKRIYIKDNESKTGCSLPEEMVDVRKSTIENTLLQTILSRILIFTPQHEKPYIITTPDHAEAIKLLLAWKDTVIDPEKKENSENKLARCAGDWGFSARWLLVGRRFAEVYANQDMISVKQYKQFIFTFGKQESCLNLKNVTSVTREKKIAKSSIWFCFLIIGIPLLLLGFLPLREKSLKITSANGAVNIPDMLSDGKMNDLIEYIRERNPIAVKV
ncbi:MAG: hypothetical protein E7199_02390 [Schwartzia succinivorans]|nr:hypothetical protein [Schwartzia succinivorans]